MQDLYKVKQSHAGFEHWLPTIYNNNYYAKWTYQTHTLLPKNIMTMLEVYKQYKLAFEVEYLCYRQEEIFESIW